MMTNEDTYQDQPETRIWYTRLGEWYLVLCYVYLLIEGIFNVPIAEALQARSFFLTQLTPWNLWPSVIYFCTIGFLIGLIIYLNKKTWHVPIKGKLSFAVLWVVLLGSGFYGFYRHNFFWHEDIRQTIFPSIVVFWAVVLAQNIRYDVVLTRIVRVAVIFAIYNLVAGILFFAIGGGYEERSFTSWRGDYILIFAYMAALSRSLITGKPMAFSLVILAMGILAPLAKPAIVTFFVGNMAIVFLSLKINIKSDNAFQKIKTVAVILVLIMAVGIFGKILLSIGGGAASDFLARRFLKVGVEEDISSGRFAVWTECVQRWQHKPIIGEGLGARHYVEGKGGESNSIPIHNYFFQFLMQTGLVGLFLIIMAAVPWFVRSFRTLSWEEDPQRQWTRLALFSYVCAIMAAGMYGDSISPRCINFVFWLVVALETAAHSQTIMWRDYEYDNEMNL
jgi:hypothetical protein